MQLDKLSFLFR